MAEGMEAFKKAKRDAITITTALEPHFALPTDAWNGIEILLATIAIKSGMPREDFLKRIASTYDILTDLDETAKAMQHAREGSSVPC